MNKNYALTSTTNIRNSDNYYIVFHLNEKQYAINIQNVMEVINIPEIEIPIITPEGIIGMFNYNGHMIKAVDINPLLGFETLPFSINNQLIIAVVEDNCFAIHTEKIINIVQLDDELIQPIPFNMKNSILSKVYKSEETIINIIDINILNQLLSNQDLKEGKINYTKLFPIDEKSKQILNIRAKQNQKTQEMFSFPFNINTINQYILFNLDKNNYYLDLKYVKEFISIKRLNITKLPYTQDYIKGIINLKGEFLVVIDLKRFLSKDSNNIEEGSKLIVVEGKDFNIAFLVDDIKYIKDLKNIQKNTMYSTNSKYIYSEFMEEGELYNILNFEKIINDERLFIDIK